MKVKVKLLEEGKVVNELEFSDLLDVIVNIGQVLTLLMKAIMKDRSSVVKIYDFNNYEIGGNFCFRIQTDKGYYEVVVEVEK